jgi:hypothetical protein
MKITLFKYKNIIFLVIFGLSFFFLFNLFHNYTKYKHYSSVEKLQKIGLIFTFLESYIDDFEEIPTPKSYFEFIRSDSNYLEGHFPGFEFPRIDPNDFVITTDYKRIHVWLFSQCMAGDDTLYVGNLTFWNFIKRKSHLVAEFNYPDPCRPEMVYILNDRKRVKDDILKNKLIQIIYEINQLQVNLNQIGFDSNLCCFKITNKRDSIIIEYISGYHSAPCELDDHLRDALVTRLSFLTNYPEYEIYLQLYIYSNQTDRIVQ